MKEPLRLTNNFFQEGTLTTVNSPKNLDSYKLKKNEVLIDLSKAANQSLSKSCYLSPSKKLNDPKVVDTIYEALQ